MSPVLPVIDPAGLSRAQRAGRRCAVGNCQRVLRDPVYQAGCFPDGRPAVVCADCASRAAGDLILVAAP